MSIAELLGHTRRLTIRRIASPGAFLAVDAADTSEQAPTILLPGVELPPGVVAGTELEVFLHLDSEGRPIATLRTPKLQLDEVAFLRVTACTEVGAFVDWGLQKELLVPFAEQTRELHVGEVHPIGLYVDSSGRLAGTMRISEMLERKVTHLRHDDWVDGEAWRKEPSMRGRPDTRARRQRPHGGRAARVAHDGQPPPGDASGRRRHGARLQDPRREACRRGLVRGRRLGAGRRARGDEPRRRPRRTDGTSDLR
jgi:hypothetical protein